MKIFISHSSKNKGYGEAIVKLLRDVGVKADDIIFTSNPAHGIPIRMNIFKWLKSRIQEQSYIIYLLSEEYYDSVACLNEMGAAWVIENKGAMLFVPGFDLDCHEFKSGALDPRDIGFFLYNEDRVIEFVESLKEDFPVSTNLILRNQAIKTFLKEVKILSVSTGKKGEKTLKPVVVPTPSTDSGASPKAACNPVAEDPSTQKYLSDLKEGILKDSDVMLIWYAAEQGRSLLRTGWQEDKEVENIRTWEDVHGYPSVLSSQYGDALRRLEIKKLVAVSKTTESGNAKEMEFISPLVDFIANRHDEIDSCAQAVIRKIQSEETKEDEYPF